MNCPGGKVLRRWRKTLGRRKAPPPPQAGWRSPPWLKKNPEQLMRVLRVPKACTYARAAVIMAME